MLKGKKILLGVTGGIAAYKSAFLVRLLVKAGADVRVIMTQMAHEFITPLTLSTLSKHPVLTEFTKGKTGEWNNHVELGSWGNAMIIAPASANTISKMAEGRSDNLLLAVFLSARCPVFLAPAMDLDMYAHKLTQENILRLKNAGVKIIAPGKGELASGLSGEGRMAEPEEIVSVLEATMEKTNRLEGKKILVTAGPTFEAIDPVRFIGNHSSGKMGFAIAGELAARGADVVLITGPVSLQTENNKVKRINVNTAAEMMKKCLKEFPSCNGAIMAAAVADYRPAKISKKKIKKEEQKLDEIKLVETEDILASLGKLKKKKQVLAGFALETENAIANAKKKLKNKKLDMIIVNSLSEKGAGFGTDTNRISIIDKNGKTSNFDLKLKKEVASDIVDLFEKKLHG
ncbi:MAG: bifunctional phosphopantothenoylcysteine decarboxylase/phosphopantothenate--cysteine ligase CoaBC [Bacteroidetes bacterium]|nr:bifunctional phosphopantothenoylcysteine decarboxylase/phosphopantothenate--cysteine ligase CoaBC [Bacteroidota bacterium]